MSSFQVRGVGYDVEVSGVGPPLVLLHGFTGSHESWVSLRSKVERGNRVVAIDLLGHGKSDAPLDPERYAMSETIADLVALFDDLGNDLVGPGFARRKINDHSRPLGSQVLRDGGSDSLGRARDDCNFAFQFLRHDPVPFDLR